MRLLDIILVAWTRCLPQPYGCGEYSSVKDHSTDCNRFVNEVCEGMGYKTFKGLLANQIYDSLMKNGEWLEVAGDVAQFHANSEALVIAAWKNPTGGHGHVCVVRPGEAEASGSWGIMNKTVPKVANVGEPDKCRIDRKASFSFAKDKIPKYFVLKSTI